MSEQTPNSSEDLSGAEPSMEDILASIRKIISDDEPVAMESPEDVVPVAVAEAGSVDPLDDLMQGIHLDSNDLTSDAVLDAAVVQDGPSAADMTPPEPESVDLNIDDVLADLDADVLAFEPEEIPTVDTDMSELDTIVSEFKPIEVAAPEIENISPADDTIESDKAMSDMDDVLARLDDDVLAEFEAVEVLPTPTEIGSDLNAAEDASDVDEMDALLDDILLTPLDDDIDDVSLETADLAHVEEGEDLELVKSLMADLADNPDAFETDEDLDALLAIPEAEDETDISHGEDIAVEAAETEADDAEPDDAEEDILGDILNITLEDEIQNHPAEVEEENFEALSAILEAEQNNIAENARPIEDAADDDLPSLSEIAAAAEADAVAVETPHIETSPVNAPQAVAATAGLGAAAGLAALGASALGDTPPVTETEAATETETAEIHAEPTPEPISPTEETSMPVKAVKTDAILDEVTETAAAGAFAELNQVVEDKAIFNERGPRIGDLVQEALRPMLKEWLDANLKGIVERAVAKEVKRISSGK